MSFPSSPSDGQIITLGGVNYSYDSGNTAWKRVTSVGTARIAYTATNTAPQGATTGDLWYKIDQGIIFEYISDGSSYQWVDITTPTISTNSNPPQQLTAKSLITQLVFSF